MNCPFCVEEINDDAKKCRHCGESLTDSPPAVNSSNTKVVLVVVLVCAVPLCLAISGVLAVLFMPALMKAKARANRAKCSNNLRYFGLASIQYADDKRFFPHVGALKNLDGGPDTNHSTKKARALVWYGYQEGPESFVCPASSDMSVPRTIGFNERTWFWGAGQIPAGGGLSPLADGAADPNLEDTSELSYGWTRKGLSSNARSNNLLIADRAVQDPAATKMLGNHHDGWNVLKADATVPWLDVLGEPFPGSFLTGTSAPGDGYLGIKVQTDRSALGW